jgi:hypothetical protein
MVSFKNLVRDISRINETDLLSAWQWRVDKQMKIIMISNLGDLFLQDEEGSIFWLITDGGELNKIASNYSEFEKMLSNEELIDNWLLPLLVEKLLKAGMTLEPNEVYSPLKMAILGGTYEPSNFKPTDMSVHFQFSGSICEQIKDLPDGTKVNIKIVD